MYVRTVPMTCRDCGLPLSVERTVDSSVLTVRIHRCGCGSRWESSQKITRRLPSILTTGSTLIAARQQPNSKIPATNGTPVAGRGVGGVPSSGLNPVTSVSSEQIGSDLGSDLRSDPARARPYPARFEAFWSATWKGGAKGAALKAWTLEKPSPESAGPAIVAYLKAKRASGQSPAHVSTWLRAGGATQIEWHLASINGASSRPALTPAVPAPYHAPAKPVQADWNQIAPWPRKDGL